MLNGYKTYIVALLAAAYGLAIQLGWLQSDPGIWGLLNGAGLATLRRAV